MALTEAYESRMKLPQTKECGFTIFGDERKPLLIEHQREGIDYCKHMEKRDCKPAIVVGDKRKCNNLPYCVIRVNKWRLE